LTVFVGPYMCGHQLIGGADVLRPWRVGSRRIGTAGEAVERLVDDKAVKHKS